MVKPVPPPVHVLCEPPRDVMPFQKNGTGLPSLWRTGPTYPLVGGLPLLLAAVGHVRSQSGDLLGRERAFETGHAPFA
jgi:hypothetical protein